MDKNLLTIKEFAKLANKTQQTIYKQLNNRLNQYIQLVDNKKMLEYRALKEVFNIGVEQPIQPELNNSFNPKKDDEIEFLRKQIEQLQKELEKEREHNREKDKRLLDTLDKIANSQVALTTNQTLDKALELKEAQEPKLNEEKKPKKRWQFWK